jgi:hypothetical protein
MEGVEHTHVHRWISDNEVHWRRFTHVHPWPVAGDKKLDIRPHRHVNGWHAHPHGHDLYLYRWEVDE